MASVRKLDPNEPKSPWVVEYTDEKGKRRRKTPKSGLKKDADLLRKKIERELGDGTHVAFNDSVTMEKAIPEFIRDCDRRAKIGDITLGTVKHYESDLRLSVLPAFGRRTVATLTSADVQAWIEEMRVRYAPHSISGHYGALYALLTYCVRRKWTRQHILRDEPCKLPAKPKRKKIPSMADIQALLDVASRRRPGDDILTAVARQCFVALGAFGTMRPGEICGLRWENVDFDAGVVHVIHSYSRTDGLKGPKSEAGVRDVPMSEPIRHALTESARYVNAKKAAGAPGYRSYKTTAFCHRVWKNWEANTPPDLTGLEGYVIPNRAGGARKTQDGNDFWHRLMADAGLVDEHGKSKFTRHALRHAAASLLIKEGLPAMNLKTIMGHAKVSTTYDIYGHLFPEDTRIVDTAHAIAAKFNATKTRHSHVID